MAGMGLLQNSLNSILFTSYWLMEKVYYGLKDRLTAYPLFLMGRGRLESVTGMDGSVFSISVL